MSNITGALASLQAVEFTSESADASARYGLDQPQVTASFSTEAPATQPSATQPAMTTIKFGRYDDVLKKNIYASSSTAAGIVKGRKISVPSLNSFLAWGIRRISNLQGWGDHGVELVVSSSAAAVALLKTGQIDGISTDFGSGLQAERRGDGRIVLRFSDYIDHIGNYFMAATTKMIEERPDELRAFVRASLETLAYIREHKRESVDILMEGTPRDLDLEELRQALQSLPGVVRAHDLHAWTVTSGMHALSAHLVVEDVVRSTAILVGAQRLLHERFKIEHSTLQIEPRDFEEAMEPHR